jgi:hypothetical protein
MSDTASEARDSPRKRWTETWSRLAILTSLLGMFGLVFWLAMKSREMLVRPTVALWVPPEALRIGTPWETENFEWVLPVENHEAVPIEVESFSRSCTCLSVEPKAFTIAPGARQELRLNLDLISQRKPSGEVDIQLMPQLKTREGQPQAKKFPPVWEIKGQVRRVLECDRRAYLGRHSELSQPLKLRTIPIKSLVPLESISAECDLPGWIASVRELKGGERELRLRAYPNNPMRR